MIPEWEPPRGMRDPLVRRLPARMLDPDRPKSGRALWSRTIRGRISELRDVAVVRTLADYGNVDGTNCHPGVKRLVDDLCSSDKTIRRALSQLAEGGWITLTQRGRRKLEEADVFELAVPAPVAVELDVWPNQDSAQWMERPDREPKRPDAAVTRDRKKRPFPQVTRDRKNGFLEVTERFLEVKNELLEVTGDLPPGPRHHVLHTIPIGSIGLTARASRQHANGHRNEPFDPDDPDVVDKIEERLEEECGGIRPDTANLVDSMASRGNAHPQAIFNAARARETNGPSW